MQKMAPTSSKVTSQPISSSSSTDLSRFVTIITAAFRTTPLTTAIIVDIDSTPPPYPSPLIDSARRERHFSKGILDSASSGAELVQAGDWSAIALWETPEYRGKPFIDSKACPPPFLAEWRGRVRAAKAKYLAVPSSKASTDSEEERGSSSSNSLSPRHSDSETNTDEPQLRPFYHLSFLARNPFVNRVDGSLNAVIAPFLERARAENVPAWLEATAPEAVRIYEHHGFRVVEEIVVGKGKVNPAGWPTEGGTGEGVMAWAMIFDSHLRD